MRQLLDTAAEVASAMAYLHSRTIVHGDLKTANVLLQVIPGPRSLWGDVAGLELAPHTCTCMAPCIPAAARLLLIVTGNVFRLHDRRNRLLQVQPESQGTGRAACRQGGGTGGRGQGVHPAAPLPCRPSPPNTLHVCCSSWYLHSGTLLHAPEPTARPRPAYPSLTPPQHTVRYNVVLLSPSCRPQRNDNDPRGFTAKLGDFGLARQLAPGTAAGAAAAGHGGGAAGDHGGGGEPSLVCSPGGHAPGGPVVTEFEAEGLLVSRIGTVTHMVRMVVMWIEQGTFGSHWKPGVESMCPVSGVSGVPDRHGDAHGGCHCCTEVMPGGGPIAED